MNRKRFLGQVPLLTTFLVAAICAGLQQSYVGAETAGNDTSQLTSTSRTSRGHAGSSAYTRAVPGAEVSASPEHGSARDFQGDEEGSRPDPPAPSIYTTLASTTADGGVHTDGVHSGGVPTEDVPTHSVPSGSATSSGTTTMSTTTSTITTTTTTPTTSSTTTSVLYKEQTEGRTYNYGYDVTSREHADHWRDAAYVIHPDDTLPYDGFVTVWHVYLSRPANLSLIVWRPYPVHPTEYRLVDYTNITVNSSGHHMIALTRRTRIPFLAGDVLGMYFPQKNPVPFSKRSSCHRNLLYLHNPCPFSRCRDFVFREQEPGWNPCRVYSISADIVQAVVPRPNYTIPVESITEPPIKEPQMIEVKLSGGRTENEGLLLVRSPGGVWGMVCADGFDDADATVACRQLGYRAGYARFPPFFGRGDRHQPIYLDDVSCNGTERNLAACGRLRSWGQHDCDHSEDVGVECFNTGNETYQVYGFPAVSRGHIDKWKRGTFIPHPHQQLPWQRGTVTSWHFYVSSQRNLSVTLQVWRRKGDTNFQLLGQTHYRNLAPGRHDYVLAEKERIFFQSGDTVGIQFDKPACIPYDIIGKSCEHEERIMYIYPSYQRPVNGRVHSFKAKPAHWKPCRMYSIYAGVQLSGTLEPTTRFTINYEKNQYRFVVDKRVTQSQAQKICQDELGHQATILEINSEEELSFINGALNSMKNMKDEGFWVSGMVHADLPFTKWAACHPVDGRECISLRKMNEGEQPTWDYFLMFSSHCLDRNYVICERKDPWLAVSEVEKEDEVPQAAPSEAAPTRKEKNIGLVAGIVVGVLVFVVASIVLTVCMCSTSKFAFHTRQRKLREMGHDLSESTVRFVSLEDKPPL